MSSLPTITVIMATIKFDPYFEEAVASVLASEDVDLRLVVIGDGTTTPLPERLRSDGRVTFIHHAERRGLAAAMNTGLSATETELVARLDADDVCFPGRLAAQAEFLTTHPDVAAVGGTAVLVDAEGRRVGDLGAAMTAPEIERSLTVSNPFVHSSIMFRRSEVIGVGGYNIDCVRMQDYELYLRLALAQKQMEILAEPAIGYRLHDAQHSKSTPPRGPGYSIIQRRRSALAAIQGRSRPWRTANRLVWIAGQWARYLGFRQPRYMRGMTGPASS